VLTVPVIELRAVLKAYGGLRPLRIADLAVAAGETVVIQGLNETAASVLVDLVTGTALPGAGRDHRELRAPRDRSRPLP
jgi:ABC-type sugar transport system ATPase subunit